MTKKRDVLSRISFSVMREVFTYLVCFICWRLTLQRSVVCAK